MGKNKFIKRIVMFIVSILVISSPIFERISYASGSKTVVINSHSYNENNNKIAISGAEFYLYKVGEYNGDKYVLTDAFKKVWADINSSVAKDEMEAANILYKYAKDNNIKGRLEITDSNGKAVFSGLGDGVYVIAQEGSVKIGNMIYSSNPFLVKSPSHFEDGNTIVVEPKYGIDEDHTPDKTENPPDKDEENPPDKEENPPDKDEENPPDKEENPPDKDEENPPDKNENTPNNEDGGKEKKVRTGDEGILNTVILFLVALIMFITINKKKNLNKK